VLRTPTRSQTYALAEASCGERIKRVEHPTCFHAKTTPIV
jgi:hypothetical protein